MRIRTLRIKKRTSTTALTKVCIFIHYRTTREAKHRELEKWRFFERAVLLLHELPFQMQMTTADQLVFFVLL